MSDSIIITRDDYGIELSVQFVNNKKKPIDITGQTVDVIVVNPNGDKTSHDAYLTEPLNGKCGIILTENETSVLGLYSAFFSLRDEDNNVTAQEDLYYFIKDKHGGNSKDLSPSIPLDDKVIDAWCRTQIIDAKGEYYDLKERLDYLELLIRGGV